MPNLNYPVGLVLRVDFQQFPATLSLLPDSKLQFEIDGGPYARREVVDTEVTLLGNSLFLVSWQEQSGRPSPTCRISIER